MQLLHAGGHIAWIYTKDRRDDKIPHRQEAYNRHNQYSPEHGSLIAYAPGDEVNQHNTDAVECMIEEGCDQRQRNNAYNGGSEQGYSLVVDVGAETQQRNVHYMDQ